jgi:hypothetical protein
MQEIVAVPPQEALLTELQAFFASCRSGNGAMPGVTAGVDAMYICNQIQLQILK